MPRTPRVLVDGGYYHIVTRGIDQRRLFRYSQDYRHFLDLTSKYLLKFQMVQVIHYCLMPNHLHFLVRADEAADLPKFLQAVLQVYASFFRKKYHSAGFIFQNRYKSKLIDNDSYLLECGRYIERNPLRAKIISNLKDYPWSSYLFYAEGKEDAIIKTASPLYLSLGNTPQERQERYREYLLQERPYEHIVDKAFRIC